MKVLKSILKKILLIYTKYIMPTISNMTKIAKIAKDNPELLQTLKASGNLKNLGNI